jgi:hypothetical protein
VNHAGHIGHWTRQEDLARKSERVYQLTRLGRTPGEPNMVVATSSKQSIQRLVAALAEQQGQDRYRVSVFLHPVLPGLER